MLFEISEIKIMTTNIDKKRSKILGRCPNYYVGEKGKTTGLSTNIVVVAYYSSHIYLISCQCYTSAKSAPMGWLTINTVKPRFFLRRFAFCSAISQ